MKTLDQVTTAIAKGKAVFFRQIAENGAIKSIKVWNDILTIETDYNCVFRYRNGEKVLNSFLNKCMIY